MFCFSTESSSTFYVAELKKKKGHKRRRITTTKILTLLCTTQQSCSRWFFEIKFNLIHLRCIHILLLYLCLHPRCFFLIHPYIFFSYSIFFSFFLFHSLFLSITFLCFVSSFYFFSVQYFLDGWLASPVLKLSFRGDFSTTSRYCFDPQQKKKYETFINNIAITNLKLIQPKQSISLACAPTTNDIQACVFFLFVCFLPVTFGDIVFFRIHYTLIKSHHDAVDYSNKKNNNDEDVDNELRRSDNIFWLCGLFFLWAMSLFWL